MMTVAINAVGPLCIPNRSVEAPADWDRVASGFALLLAVREAFLHSVGLLVELPINSAYGAFQTWQSV